MSRLASNLRGMAYVTRYPATDKQNRIMTAAWAVSAAFAVLSIVAHTIMRQWASPFLWMVIALLVLDVYMLRLCFQGARYRKRRRARRRAERT